MTDGTAVSVTACGPSSTAAVESPLVLWLAIREPDCQVCQVAAERPGSGRQRRAGRQRRIQRVAGRVEDLRDVEHDAHGPGAVAVRPGELVMLRAAVTR
jgi:hypothetical protein